MLKLVREATQLDIKRGDIKADMLSPHHLMHIRVVDEHGRQLGAGRSLAALKGDLGSQARGAFQALASLKLGAIEGENKSRSGKPDSGGGVPLSNQANVAIGKNGFFPEKLPQNSQKNTPKNTQLGTEPPAQQAGVKHTTWAFGELPELMEIKKGGQTLIGFPALIDQGDSVSIEVFDEPEAASAKHRAGLRRLFGLQIKDALRYLKKTCCSTWP